MVVTIGYARACFAGGFGHAVDCVYIIARQSPAKMVIARAIERHSKL